MDASKCDDFDPFAVPTLPQLVAELDAAGSDLGDGPAWKKTSLKESLGFFERRFLKPLRGRVGAGKREDRKREEAGRGEF